MEEIKYLHVKVKGVLPKTTFLEVIGIITNNSIFYIDPIKIKDFLFGHNKVCTGKFPFTISNDNLVYNIQVKDIFKNEEDEDKYPFIQYLKVTTLPQLVKIKHIDFEIGHIDLSNVHLTNYLDTINIYNINEIYFHQNEKLYGPFKYEKNLISPVKNKEVQIYNCYDIAILKDFETDSLFYVKPIDESIGFIDCMNNVQLIEFFKTKVSKSKEDNELFNKVKLYFEGMSNGSHLDQIRLKRVNEIIDQIQFTEDELEIIINKNNRWNEIFNNQIEIYEVKLKDLIKIDLSKELDEISRKKDLIISELEQLKFEKQSINSQIESSSKKLQLIEESKDLLITSIKVQSEIGVSNSLNSNTFNSYFDVVNHINNYTSNLSDEEKINQICDDIEERNKLEKFIDILASKNLFYCNEAHKLIDYLKIFNQYTIVFQNVEVDWIKYEKLHKNGLEFIIDRAIENPNSLNVLILNDFNVAAFELYAKPIIDLLQNKRPFIPGTNFRFPDNLKIFLVESSMSDNEDLFSNEIESIAKIVEKIDLEEVKFLKRVVRNIETFDSLVWQNVL